MGNNNKILKYIKGDRIFAAGDKANCAYIVDSGTVGLYPNTNSDDLFAIVNQGDLLGEMGVIDQSARSVSAYAETDLELLVIDREQIQHRLKQSDPIIRSLMDVLLKRVRRLINPEYDHEGSHTDDEKVIVQQGMHKMRFENELNRALENDEIINVYQPMVDLSEGYIAGFEALSRWTHAEKGMISPFEFITLAEETDLIISMGLKIFNGACKQLAEFQKIRNQTQPNLPPLFMSINVSSAQLSAKGFLSEIKRITEKYGVAAENVKIEITESLVVDYKKVQSWIDDCHELGYKLSLDDFGTGYSGFQHLLELDFQTIKIDQAFTKTIDTNPKSLIMLEVITDMAKRMNMSIVAEGIEDQRSADLLKKLGVDYGQGYFFYKPMLSADLLEIL
jgi:EAL domain-containing protein (putative c-di-GMP-specific phosphodiesterase class I)